VHGPCLVSLAAVHAFCAFCAECSPQHCKSRLPCHDLKTLVLSDRHTGAAANATYGNFTSDRIFHSPTDRNWIIARVLVFNDSDTAAALTYSGNITLSPYSTASMPAHTLCSMSVSSGHACHTVCPLLCAIQVVHACNAAAVSELYTKPCILLLEDAHKLHCNSSCSTCESQRHIRVCCQQTKHMHALVPMFLAATYITMSCCMTVIWCHAADLKLLLVTSGSSLDDKSLPSSTFCLHHSMTAHDKQQS